MTKIINDSIYELKLTILNEMTVATKTVKEANDSLLIYNALFQEKTKTMIKFG